MIGLCTMSVTHDQNPDPADRRLRDTRLAGALLASSGVVFMLLNTVAESIYPDYSVRTDALSVLGGTGQSTTLLWDGQLFVSGVLAALGVYLLLSRGAVPQLAKRRLVKVVYLLPPAATIVVSLVPWNTVIAVHTLAAFTTFLFGGISAIYAFRFTRPPFRFLSVILGSVALLSLPFLLQSSSYLGFGGFERLVVYPVVLWQIAFGAYWMGFSG
jgi:hypothetical membrane protein